MMLVLITFVGILAGIHLVERQDVSNIDHQTQSKLYDGVTTESSTEYVHTKESIDTSAPFVVSTTTISSSTTHPLSVVVANPITAYAYLVGNVATGQIYISSHINTVLPVASMSKLMTAIVATNIFSSTTLISITPTETDVASDTSNIRAGETFSFKDLLYPLLLNSSNIAAEAIASTSGRTHFMDTMSNTAWEIGMPTAYFADPSGLDPHNHATAKDIFALARYVYTYRPDIFEITRTVHVSVATTTDHDAHDFTSIHPFVTDPRFIGGKTGRTDEAGETMLTVLRINDQSIAFIVLHSRFGARTSDTRLLIERFVGLNK